jgi:hypothetical protein
MIRQLATFGTWPQFHRSGSQNQAALGHTSAVTAPIGGPPSQHNDIKVEAAKSKVR